MAYLNDNTIESNFKDLFWELLPDYSFDITNHGNVNEAFKKIIFSRNKNYELWCRMEANIGDDIKARMRLSPFKNEPEMKAGLLNHGDNLIANQHGHTAEIKSFHFNRMDANQDPCFIEGNAYQLRITSIKESEESGFIQYWYLNNLGTAGPWCRASEREFKTILKLKIDNIEKEIERPALGGISIDCIRLSINNKTFIFGEGNKTFSAGTPCSYLRFSIENLPSKEELEAIENTLSFIFGKIFMFIGYSKYNSDWLLTEILFQDPYMYVTSLEKITKMPCYEPFIIKRVRLGDSETVINHLLGKYFELAKILPLNEVVEAINMFRLFPYDFKLMPLSAALDMIKDAWFKSDRSVSKGKYLADTNFDTVILKHLSDIQAELRVLLGITPNEIAPAEATSDKTIPIINRIKGANNLSNNERIQVFFKELGLKISEVEINALRTRNIVVHGATKGGNDQQFLDNVHIYYTLLNKVLLKLLSYDGLYLDYGTHGGPQRQIKTM